MQLVNRHWEWLRWRAGCVSGRPIVLAPARSAGWWLIFVLALFAAQVEAGDVPGRPRVGLVLGGGGARGAAHIGVLEVLEDLRVPIDCIAGTSMGALVAGAYAAGLTPAMMREELATADWDDLFRDDPPFAHRNFRRKEIDRRYLPASETGVGEDGVRYQSGVVTGQKIKLFFNRLIGDPRGQRQIETLPLPLSIIATDIVQGQRVVFREGSLSAAMRASMSVPGLMSPVEVDGQKLVDGGLVDNVPIAEARARCQADVVIVVNVGSPLLKAEEIGGLLSISVQMVNILTEQNVIRSLGTLKPQDIYIRPDLEGIGAGDFKRTSETATRGARAAADVASRLRALSVSEANYASWCQRLRIAHDPPLPVDEVEVAGMQRVNPAVLTKYLHARPGEPLDPAVLEADLHNIYGHGDYEHVDYALLRSVRGRRVLRITPVEKSWGPDYLRYGLSLDTNFKGDSTYGLRAAYHRTWLNQRGGELLVSAGLGSRTALGVDYYQPFDGRQRYFFETRLDYNSNSTGIYQDNERLAEYRVAERSASLAVGSNLDHYGHLLAGWRDSHFTSRRKTGLPFFPEESQRNRGWFAALDLDQTDRLYFPTSGWSSSLHYFAPTNGDYTKLEARLGGYLAVGNWVVGSRLSYQGSLTGDLAGPDLGSLGGTLNMTAFAVGQLRGDDMRYASLRAEHIVGRLPLGLRGDMRLGLALEVARVGRPATETNLRGWINSTAIYLGGETPLGPVYLGYGHSTSGKSGGYGSFYLFLGTP